MQKYVVKMIWDCSCIAWSVFVFLFCDKEGGQIPYLVRILEVPKMIQNVLEYVQESKLAIWEWFKPPKTFKNILTSKEKQTNHLKLLPYFGPYFGAWSILAPQGIKGPSRTRKHQGMPRTQRTATIINKLSVSCKCWFYRGSIGGFREKSDLGSVGVLEAICILIFGKSWQIHRKTIGRT